MSSCIDDIIKLKHKKQAPRGKGAVSAAGGGRKTKQQIVQKQVIRQQQQQKRSKLSIPKVNCLCFHVSSIAFFILALSSSGKTNKAGPAREDPGYCCNSWEET